MPLPQVNLTGVNELFRPDRVAQVIVNTEAYGTPVLDRFYPEARRRAHNSVLVPLSMITKITRAVPVVLRGAQGIPINVASGSYNYIEPQPIKTRDSIRGDEVNNAMLAGMQTAQEWANGRIEDHLQSHRLTTEALAAQSLTGTITFPVADAQGAVMDTYTVAFGSNNSYTVSANWTASATKISTIYKDLKKMKQQLQRKGYNGTRVLCGESVMVALIDKVQNIPNDTRTQARFLEDGSIRIGEFVLIPFDAEYYHPGGPGGTSPAPGYTKVIGDNEIMMYDPNAPFSLLRVKLDNLKLPPNPAPLGVITELTKDGSALEMFVESKPFPIPVPAATTRTDVTQTS